VRSNPESLLKIIDTFEVLPQEALYVGDSEVDALAARQAAIPLVAYKNAALEAELHVDSFRDLQDWMKAPGGFPRG